MWIHLTAGFPGGSVVKNPSANAGDVGSISGSGRSPGEGNDSPLQCSCLEKPMDREAWWATIHVVIKVKHVLVTEQHFTVWMNIKSIMLSERSQTQRSDFCRFRVSHSSLMN